MLQPPFDIGGTFTEFALSGSETGHVDVWKVGPRPASLRAR